MKEFFYCFLDYMINSFEFKKYIKIGIQINECEEINKNRSLTCNTLI